jgi:hypothetical protein
MPVLWEDLLDNFKTYLAELSTFNLEIGERIAVIGNMQFSYFFYHGVVLVGIWEQL